MKSNQFGVNGALTLHGDANAQNMVKNIWYDTSIQTTDNISTGADIAGLACLSIGFIPGYGACELIGTTADVTNLALRGAKAIDSGCSDDISEFWESAIIKGAGFGIASFLTKNSAKFSLKIGKKIKNFNFKIKKGKTGIYYQLGKRGAIKTIQGLENEMKKLLAEELAENISSGIGKSSSIIIKDMSSKIWKMLKKQEN